jgi:choline dehydrogenase
MNNVLKPMNQIRHLFSFFMFKTGPLTISPLEAVAFLKSDPTLSQPDIEFQFVPGHIGNETDLAHGVDIYKPNSYPKTDGFTILPVLLQPQSRGYIGLRSANPLDAPIIQQNYLKDEADRDLLIKAFHLTRKVMFADAFQPYTRRFNYPSVYDSDEAILQHIKNTMECVYHPVGTCRMGTDVDAVVDAELRVQGIEGLRVADASVMPRIVSGNTNAACIMIGEKAADLILA